eukprot:1138503-Pelagomonas_calceolata.AAC.15
MKIKPCWLSEFMFIQVNKKASFLFALPLCFCENLSSLLVREPCHDARGPGDESKPSPKKEQAEKQSQQEPVKKNQKATAGRIERPGIVIGPSQEGGPCLGPASGAEEVADRLRAASPFEPISE